ncbi:VHS-domain-containing protein [Atractiella rhizophila]|nr:VHS-domain-containing protein [Atractiella rhizophila]
MRSQPDLALNLEIADFVNQKKANAPREACFHVVELINNRDQHVSMLSLTLLDILVKNCSYPVHLQIATKDFLNELVRRFPEKPPAFPPPPMAKILEMIHEWKNTLCVSSKHKEDLVHIRDMHRLLGYKGYRFPTFDRRSAGVLNPADSLKTPDELEEEDRAAQSAKLQELIRRGTPKDLQAAQELMKVMAGADTSKRPDYASQTSKELDKIQNRVLVLNEMLDNATQNEKFVEGDAYDQVAKKCRQVQPKIQQWIGDAAENDPDSMDRLLMINDLINNILQRYESFKKGDRSVTAEVMPNAAASTSKSKEVSLIDFDDFEAQPATSNPGPSAVPSNSGLSSLLDLDPSFATSSPVNSNVLNQTNKASSPLSTINWNATSAPPIPSLIATPTSFNSISSSQPNFFPTMDLLGESGGGIRLPSRVNTPMNGSALSSPQLAALGSTSTSPLTQNQATSSSSRPIQQTAQKQSDPFGDLLDLKF